MNLRSFYLWLIAFFLFIPLSTAQSIENLADYDIELDFELTYEENLAEGISGGISGTYIISTDSEDEVYWNIDYNCGFNLLITDKNILETEDYEVVYEWESACKETSLGWEYLISQNETYNGRLSIRGNDFIQDDANYWYYYELYTIDEVSEVTDFVPVVGEFTIEFDELDEPFTDVNGHWAENYINSLASLGDVTGYGDDTFRPDQNISRAEMLILTINAIIDPYAKNNSCDYDFDLNADYSESFTDMDSSHWAFSYVEAAVKAGVISGYDDDTFRPDQSVTRAEALSILLETYFACGDYHGLDNWYPNYDRYSSDPVVNDGVFWSAYLEQGYEVASEENLALGFSDITGNWQRFYAHFADIHGMVSGYTNADTGYLEFRPDNPITRAEVSKIAWKLRVNPHDTEPF